MYGLMACVQRKCTLPNHAPAMHFTNKHILNYFSTNLLCYKLKNNYNIFIKSISDTIQKYFHNIIIHTHKYILTTTLCKYENVYSLLKNEYTFIYFVLIKNV